MRDDSWFFVCPTNPVQDVARPEIINDVIRSVEQAGNIPNEFP